MRGTLSRELTELQGVHCHVHRAAVAKGCLSEDLSEQNCFLLFQVQRQGDDIPCLASLRDLETTKSFPALAHFMKQQQAARKIPVPGEVDMVMGGPPCQGTSGLNLHRSQDEDVLVADAR